MGFPGGASSKEPTCQCRRHKRSKFDPWVRKIPWRRAWQPTPVFLPGESHGQRRLMGDNPRDCKESDTTETTKHRTAHRVLARGLWKQSEFCYFMSISGIHLECEQSSIQHPIYPLLLLSHFSRARLLATPGTAAHQAPPSMGFSRQEYWSGCHRLVRYPLRQPKRLIWGPACSTPVLHYWMIAACLHIHTFYFCSSLSIHCTTSHIL